MKLVETEFDTWYDKLTEAWTLAEDGESINTAAVVDMSTLKVDNLTEEDWAKIKEASIALCKKFRVSETSWPYQFQLQYNAFQAEMLALNLLNKEAIVRDGINKMLEANNAPYRVDGTYKFNSSPCEHHLLGADSQLVGRNSDSVDSENSSVVDILASDADNKEVDNKERVTKIEVKCVAGADAEKNAKHFHNCQVLFIFNILNDTCTIYSVNRIKQKESFKVENVDIRSKCIVVDPKVDWSVAPKVKITCSRWGSKN